MERKIPFNKPLVIGSELTCIEKAIKSGRLCGDGNYTKLCNTELENKFGAKKTLITTSCSHALEMCAILADIKPGDEVIMPSFTFVSTANAFVLRGAKIIFVDINPKTMNIDETLIERAITPKTKAIVPMHYGGIACEMDVICDIAQKHKLVVIEDAAQGAMAKYKEKFLGTIGDLGCYSFHETKNYTMGEGGAICINNEHYFDNAEIIREKGTDRSKFLRGQIDKYSWKKMGSSYLPSELNAAYLYAQLPHFENVNNKRLKLWDLYNQKLEDLEKKGIIERPYVPKSCEHNAHLYYIKVSNIDERTELIDYLKERGIQAVFHYVPLHSSEAGEKYGFFCGEDKYTTKESERLLRLPMFYDLTEEEVEYVCETIKKYYIK